MKAKPGPVRFHGYLYNASKGECFLISAGHWAHLERHADRLYSAVQWPFLEVYGFGRLLRTVDRRRT